MLARVLLHPALSLILLTLYVWSLRLQPLPRASGNWPPGASRPAGALASNSVECRTLAWAIRDGDGWRFVISPWAGEDDQAACSVNVLLDHGSFGYPYPAKVGWWGTRAIMHQRERLSEAEHLALFRAAAAFLREHDGTPESDFVSLLEKPNVTEVHTVPYGELRNTASMLIAVLGMVGGVRCLAYLVVLLARAIERFEARRAAKAARKTYTCASCGYDLRGLPERRCPECGTVWT